MCYSCNRTNKFKIISDKRNKNQEAIKSKEQTANSKQQTDHVKKPISEVGSSYYFLESQSLK